MRIATPIEDLQILRKPRVLELVGLSPSRIDQLERQGLFPRRVHIGTNSIGWTLGEIREWLAARIAASKGGPEHKPAANAKCKKPKTALRVPARKRASQAKKPTAKTRR